MTEEEREAWDIVAQGLEETGEYRVIRKLRPVERYAKADGEPVETGLVLDTETTGLDAQADEVIELGMIRLSMLRRQARCTGSWVSSTNCAIRDAAFHARLSR